MCYSDAACEEEDCTVGSEGGLGASIWSFYKGACAELAGGCVANASPEFLSKACAATDYGCYCWAGGSVEKGCCGALRGGNCDLGFFGKGVGFVDACCFFRIEVGKEGDCWARR